MANDGKKKTGEIIIAKQKVFTGGHWKFVPQANGLYRIQNRDSKMFLANYGINKRGSKIRQTNTPGGGALWKVVRLQDGRILIQNNASLLFIGTISSRSKEPLIQSGVMSKRITWLPIEVKAGNGNTPNVATNNGLPKNTNVNAFKPRRGGRIARVVVRYSDQISVIGGKIRAGERIYFFPQQLAKANSDGISFNPKKPSICGQTFTVRDASPRVVLNKPMPNMRNRVNDNFMFVVEIY